MARNKFKAAINHIKSTRIDEKIQRLNEAPTNNMSGVYDLSPRGQRYGEKNPEKTFYANLDGSWPPGVPGTPGERKYVRPIGYWEEGPGTTPSVQHDEIVELDFSYDTQTDDPRNTKTLIDETTGRVKTDLPPNSRSFILGPLVDMFWYNHGYDSRTFVGYIQKDTREFVLLGSIPRTWGDDNNGVPIRADGYEGRTGVWDGTDSDFISYNPSFTFEMLQWHHERLKEGKYVKNVSFFNSGGTPIIQGAGGTGQPAGTNQGNVSGTPGPGNAGNNGNANQTHGSGGNPNIGTKQNPPIMGNPHDEPRPYEPLEDQGVPHDIYGDLLLLGLSAAAAFALAKVLAAASAAALSQANRIALSIKNRILRGALNPFGQRAVRSGAAGRTRVDVYSGRPYRGTRGYGKTTYGTTDKATGNTYTNPGPFKGTPGTGGSTNPKGTLDKGTLPQRYIDKYGSRSVLGQRQFKMGKKAAKRTFGEEFFIEEVGGDIISALEDALKETETIEQYMTILDVVIGMIEKRQSNVKKQVKESRQVLAESRQRILREIKQPVAEVSELKPKKLKKYRPNFKGRFTAQNTPDVTACKESDNMVKAKNAAGQTWRTSDKYWGGYESQERINVIYDHVGHGNLYWDEIVAHNQGKKGVRNRDVQEELNKHYALLAERKIMNEQETLNAPNDPLIKRIKNKLATQIDYPDKPSPMGYPDGPTPQQVAGYHPEYGKRANYYDRLDQKSADAMPATGDPEIDAKVNAQKTPVLKRVSAIRKKKGKPNS